MENKLIVSSSPHIRSDESISKIMRDVVIALLPATAAEYIFPMGAVSNYCFCNCYGVTENCTKIRKTKNYK